MSSPADAVAVEPILTYPHAAEVSKTYLLTVDLRPLVEDSAWPDRQGEEYVVNCDVDSWPLFRSEAVGEPIVVLHRFGGSYGPARFLLIAAPQPRAGVIRITLSNAWGVPLTVFETPTIRVESQVSMPAVPTGLVVSRPPMADSDGTRGQADAVLESSTTAVPEGHEAHRPGDANPRPVIQEIAALAEAGHYHHTLARVARLQDGDEQAAILEILAPGLPSEWLSEAVAVAREIAEPSARSKALASLAPRVPGLRRGAVRAEALAAARAIADEGRRVEALLALLPHLSERGERERGEAVRDVRATSASITVTDAVLSWTDPNGSPRRITLTSTLLIARSDDRIVINQPRDVARAAEIVPLDRDLFILRPRGRSRVDGIWLNGKPTTQDVVLRPGDQFTMDGILFQVLLKTEEVDEGVPTTWRAIPAAADRAVVRRWFKKMSRADAQRPKSGTNPTGHLTLTQNHFPIDHRTYFRTVFFGDQDWVAVSAADSGGREEAAIPIEVVMRGSNLGLHSLRVDHNPAYEAGQGNRTTLLHWGSELNEYLRGNDVVGDHVTLEKFDDGSYRLVVASAPTGPFVA